MLTADEQTLVAARPNVVDYDRVKELHYLGNYVRPLPVNLERMMENAHDWAHLPYMHRSSFSSIDLINSGRWGWRAKIGIPGGGHQLLDLLVDNDRHYWVSTVFSGPGQGIEIHTQATATGEDQIEVDVRFFLPQDPGAAQGQAILGYMQQQYATLYDEDEDLMSGRQSALDDAALWRGRVAADAVQVGAVDDLNTDQIHIVETGTGRFCVRYWVGRWIAHSAICPHLLGPLDEAAVDEAGRITCPWHGYRFDVVSGQEADGQCRTLETAELVEKDGKLFLQPSKP